MITNIDFEFREPWTWISTQLNFWLVILLLYRAKERHTWVPCVRQMKINGNNKIIFYLTSLSICFSKSPAYWMCLSLHSFPLQTSAPPSPASHCTGLWEHKQFSGKSIQHNSWFNKTDIINKISKSQTLTSAFLFNGTNNSWCGSKFPIAHVGVFSSWIIEANLFHWSVFLPHDHTVGPNRRCQIWILWKFMQLLMILPYILAKWSSKADFHPEKCFTLRWW